MNGLRVVWYDVFTHERVKTEGKERKSGMFKVEVKFTPENVKRWIVTRRDKYTADLWYYDSFDDEKRARDLAQELDDGVVVESVAE